jgi:hypothetical protein
MIIVSGLVLAGAPARAERRVAPAMLLAAAAHEAMAVAALAGAAGGGAAGGGAAGEHLRAAACLAGRVLSQLVLNGAKRL